VPPVEVVCEPRSLAARLYPAVAPAGAIKSRCEFDWQDAGQFSASRAFGILGGQMWLDALVVRCAVFVFMVVASPAFADQIAVVGTPDQQQQVQASLQSCPSLKASLEKAVTSGLFADIHIVPRSEVRAIGPFEAAVRGHEIVLTPQWLEVQNVPYFDVRTEGEILPVVQLSQLMMNLRYRFALMPAMAERASPRLGIASDGSISLTEKNIAAVSAVLEHSSVADLQ